MNDFENFLIELDLLEKEFTALSEEQENYLDHILKLNERLADFLFSGQGWKTLCRIHNNTLQVFFTFLHFISVCFISM